MICFLFAMAKECVPLLKEVEVMNEKEFGYTKVYEVRKEGSEFLIAVSGIGKAFAAASIPAIVAHYEVDAFFNIGVAGSQDKSKADIFSCVIGSSYVEHDLDSSALGDPKGMVSGIDLVSLPSSKLGMHQVATACDALNIPHTFGVISSGDTFIADKQKKKEVTELFGSLSLDMESAPFAQIAYVYHVPYVSARVISDAEHPEIEYLENVEEASKRASKIALQIALHCINR